MSRPAAKRSIGDISDDLDNVLSSLDCSSAQEVLEEFERYPEAPGSAGRQQKRARSRRSSASSQRRQPRPATRPSASDDAFDEVGVHVEASSSGFNQQWQPHSPSPSASKPAAFDAVEAQRQTPSFPGHASGFAGTQEHREAYGGLLPQNPSSSVGSIVEAKAPLDGSLEQLAMQAGFRPAPEYGVDMFVASMHELKVTVDGRMHKMKLAHQASLQALQRYVESVEQSADSKDKLLDDLHEDVERERRLRAAWEQQHVQLQKQVGRADARAEATLSEEQRLRLAAERERDFVRQEALSAVDGAIGKLEEERRLRLAIEEERDQLRQQAVEIQISAGALQELEEERQLRLAVEQERDRLQAQLEAAPAPSEGAGGAPEELEQERRLRLAAEEERDLLREQLAVAPPAEDAGSGGDLAEELATQTKRAEAAEEKLRALVAKIKAASSRKG